MRIETCPAHYDRVCRRLRLGAFRWWSGVGRQCGAMTAMTDHSSRGRRMLNKVPEVTLYFWVIKVLCTTVGETASDYLSDNVGLGLTNTPVSNARRPRRHCENTAATPNRTRRRAGTRGRSCRPQRDSAARCHRILLRVLDRSAKDCAARHRDEPRLVSSCDASSDDRGQGWLHECPGVKD